MRRMKVENLIHEEKYNPMMKKYNPMIKSCDLCTTTLFLKHTHTEKQTVRSQNHNRFLRSCHYHFLLLLFLPLWFRQWSLHSQVLVFFAEYIHF